MRKLNVDEWPIKTVIDMYEFSNSAVRVNNTVGNKLHVKDDIRQGSVVSSLLFIVVLEGLSRKFRNGLPQEMIYSDGLKIIAKILEEH